MRKNPQKGSFRYVGIGAAFLLFVGALCLLLVERPESASPAEPLAIQSTSADKGPEQQPYLYTPNGTELVVCLSREGLAQFNRMALQHDPAGLRHMFETGEAMEVDNNVRVSIINLGTFASEVLILSGQHTGSTAFIATGFIRGLR